MYKREGHKEILFVTLRLDAQTGRAQRNPVCDRQTRCNNGRGTKKSCLLPSDPMRQREGHKEILFVTLRLDAQTGRAQRNPVCDRQTRCNNGRGTKKYCLLTSYPMHYRERNKELLVVN